MNDPRLIIGDLNSVCRAGWLGLVGVLALCLAGCSTKTLDPSQIGRFRPTPAVNVILDSLGVAEEAPSAWVNAEEPKPEDVKAVRSDYRLRSGDLVRISIFELYQDGAMVTNDYVVSETGKISVPVVGPVQAAGLSETQLQEEIKQILTPNILKEPSVTVALLNSQQRKFSILGNGVPAPGPYPIPRYDFRLTEALAMAGGPDQFNVSAIYVARAAEGAAAGGLEIPMEELELLTPRSSGAASQPGAAMPAPPAPASAGRQREIPTPTEPAERFELEREMLDLIAPSVQSAWPATDKVVADAAPAKTDSPLVIPKPAERIAPARQETIAAAEMPLPKGFQWVVPPKSAVEDRVDPASRNAEIASMSEFGPGAPGAASTPAGVDEHVEWVFQDGRWMLIETGPGGAQPVASQAPTPTAGPTLPMEQEWAEAIQTRLLKVPAEKLLSGDPRYNIIIKPGDTIHVPVDIIGTCLIMGNVVRAGEINITGRPMTLKMAVAAAGGLGPLAYPKYCEVVRRVGENKEEIVMVDLDKIASGEQPDFFIKPNDLINVGTHPTSRWRAVLRSAFRAAYGFAFVYDRNFADADYGDGIRLPSWL